MSRYKQASLRRKMRTADRERKRKQTKQHQFHWVAPSLQKNTSGQRRHRREKAERFARAYGAGERIVTQVKKEANGHVVD